MCFVSDLMLICCIDGLAASVFTFWRPKSKQKGSTPTKQVVTAFAQEFPFRKYPSVGCSLSVAFPLCVRGIGKFGRARSGRVRKFTALFPRPQRSATCYFDGVEGFLMLLLLIDTRCCNSVFLIIRW